MGFAGAGPLPGLDTDSTLVTGGAPQPTAVQPSARPPAAPTQPEGKKVPIGLILGAGGGVAAAAIAAWLFLGQGGSGPQQPVETAQQRQEQIRRDAEQRAREEAERLQRQAAQDQLAATAAAEGRRQQEQAAAGDGTAAADAERRRQAEAQQAAAADAERRRQAEAQQAAAAADAERRRQAEAQQAAGAAAAAAEAERRRQAEAQQAAGAAAAAAEAERSRQAEAQQAALQRNAAELRAAAAAAAVAEPCSLISWSAVDDRVTLSGIIRRGGEAVVEQAFATRGISPQAVQLQLQSFEGPYCAALDAIRGVAATSAEALPRARVLGTTPLAKGELLRMTVDMPDYPAQLYVSYFMKSGEVAHLVPSRPEAGRARVALGDPAPGFPGWEVDEPFGVDLVIVFASERPIFPQRRPVVEQQADYLAALTSRIRALQGQGVRLTARALLVETVPRR